MLSEYISSNESETRIFRIRSNQQNASSKKQFGKKNKGYQQEPSVGVMVVLFKTPGHMHAKTSTVDLQFVPLKL